MASEEPSRPPHPQAVGVEADDDPRSTLPPADTRPLGGPLSQAAADFGLASARHAESTDPLIGANLDGVIIEEFIGQGGMGRIYRARQTHPARVVAVKVMRSIHLGPAATRRFMREADALARLRHPGIAQVFTAGCHRVGIADVPYFVMEYVPDAASITQACERRRLAPRRRLEMLRDACEAIAHGHAAGIVHRDVKPANVLVDATGRTKVIDFGIARMDGVDEDAARTETGHLVGTPPYMAPEQLADGRTTIDARTDVYALGLLMHDVLAGRLPYDVAGKSLVETAQVVQQAVPSRLDIAGAGPADRDLVRGAAAIAARCLRKNPAERYPSAAELVDDLRRVLAGEPPIQPVGAAGLRERLAWPRRAAPLVILCCTAGLAAVWLTRGLTWPPPRAIPSSEVDSPTHSSTDARGPRAVPCRFATVSSGRTSPLEWVDVSFAEDVFGLTAADFVLARNGVAIPAPGMLVAGGPRHWRIGKLSALTSDEGDYTLSIAGTPQSPVDGDSRVVAVAAQARWRSPAYRELRVDLLTDDWDRHVVGLDAVERYTERSAGSTTFIRPTLSGREGAVTLRFDLPFVIQDASLVAPLSIWTTGDPFPYDPGARAALDVSSDGESWTLVTELKAGAGGTDGRPHDIGRLVAGGTSVWVRARLTGTREWPNDGLIFAQFLRTSPGENAASLVLSATGPHPPVIPGQRR